MCICLPHWVRQLFKAWNWFTFFICYYLLPFQVYRRHSINACCVYEGRTTWVKEGRSERAGADAGAAPEQAVGELERSPSQPTGSSELRGKEMLPVLRTAESQQPLSACAGQASPAVSEAALRPPLEQALGGEVRSQPLGSERPRGGAITTFPLPFSPVAPSANGNAASPRCAVLDALLYKCIKKSCFSYFIYFLVSPSFLFSSLLRCPHSLLDGLLDSTLVC